MAFEFRDIQKLAELLKQPEESDGEDDLPQNGFCRMGPGDITTHKADPSRSKEDGDDIWQEAEVAENVVRGAECDPRERPEYQISYKQQVTSEEVFLQMSGRTPSTSSCEDLVVTIKLPGETLDDVNLTVTEHRLDVRSARYYLSLDLPHPVNTSSSKAEWLCEQDALRVVLRMEREFDFINF